MVFSHLFTVLSVVSLKDLLLADLLSSLTKGHWQKISHIDDFLEDFLVNGDPILVRSLWRRIQVTQHLDHLKLFVEDIVHLERTRLV